MEFQNTSMEKSWKKYLSCTRIIQKKCCAARAYSNDNHEIGVVCFIFCGEGVTKRGDVEATVKQSEMIMSYIYHIPLIIIFVSH